MVRSRNSARRRCVTALMATRLEPWIAGASGNQCPTSSNSSWRGSRPAASMRWWRSASRCCGRPRRPSTSRQGEFVMLPAFFVLVAMNWTGVPFWGAVAIGILVSALIARAGVQAPAGRPDAASRRVAARDRHDGARAVHEGGREGLLRRGGAAVPAARGGDEHLTSSAPAVAVQSLIVVGIAVAAVVALQFFLNRTRTGRMMQATAAEPDRRAHPRRHGSSA